MATTTPPESHPPESNPGARPRRVFFPCFDGYRALAAGAVLLLHVGVASGFAFRHSDLGQYVFRLDVGVAVFFLISGFLLYRPFVAAHLADGGPGPRPGDYFRGRFLRIFPAYWVALTAVVLFQHGPMHRIHDLGDFLSYYLLLQQYTVAHHFGGIQQAWTLSVEISFYVFLPLWALAIRALARRASNRLAVELGGLAVLYVTGLVWRGLFAHFDPSHANLGLHVLPAFFDEFALGMALAVVSVWAVAAGPDLAAVRAGGAPPVGVLAPRGGVLLGRVDPARHPDELRDPEREAVAVVDGVVRVHRVLPAPARDLRAPGPGADPRRPAQPRRSATSASCRTACTCGTNSGSTSTSTGRATRA